MAVCGVLAFPGVCGHAFLLLLLRSDCWPAGHVFLRLLVRRDACCARGGVSGGGDACVSSPAPSSGIGILCRGSWRATTDRLFEVRAKAWTATPADAATSLVASSSYLFSCRYPFLTVSPVHVCAYVRAYSMSSTVRPTVSSFGSSWECFAAVVQLL